jgi:hypothetical protein
MTTKFRYIGALTEIQPRGLRLSKLGEEFEADPADVLAEGGIPALPSETFAEIFSEVPADVLAKHQAAASRVNIPDVLAAALTAAGAKLNELRGGE